MEAALNAAAVRRDGPTPGWSGFAGDIAHRFAAEWDPMAVTRFSASSIASVIVLALAVFEPVAMAEPPRSDLVLVGTVSSIRQGGSRLKPWVVMIDVEKVVSGELSDRFFSFAIHSPSRAGLEKGHAYTVRAVWQRDHYEVDEMQWRVPNRAGPGRRLLRLEP
jgi:hypothetical protein